VTVTTTVTATDSAPLLVEIARFAYRPATAPGAPGAPAAPPAPPAPRDSTAPRPLDVGSGEWLTNADGIWTARPNPVVLARYSALTANGHRIHYDLPYATQVEGYPSLLVHGPLMATIVSESVRRDHPDRELVGFTCRAQRPYFLGSDATIRLAGSADDRVELELSDGAGEVGSPANLTATVTMR
jgi:3-methylfumaryl-CoA hydratase